MLERKMGILSSWPKLPRPNKVLKPTVPPPAGLRLSLCVGLENGIQNVVCNSNEVQSAALARLGGTLNCRDRGVVRSVVREISASVSWCVFDGGCIPCGAADRNPRGARGGHDPHPSPRVADSNKCVLDHPLCFGLVGCGASGHAHLQVMSIRVVVSGPNKPLVPTRNGEAPLLAAQRQRWIA